MSPSLLSVGAAMLTDTEIRKSKARRLTDGGGLYLVGKLWRYKYRFESREKLMSFGKYPDVPLVSARALHAAARRLLASGVDPMAARKAERVPAAAKGAVSFEDVATLWMAHWRVDKSAQHVDSTWRRLQANVFPHLRYCPIEAVTAPDLVVMVKAIEARGVSDLAKRALETVGQIMRYGVAHGHCKRNPCADFKPGDVLRPARREHMARVGAAELPGLLRAIEVYQGKVITRLAVKLIALTFVRTSELIGGKWSEIDRDAKRWNIPAERMKMKTPHIVPLSSQALEVLELLRMVSGDGEYIFPGEQESATMSNNTILFASGEWALEESKLATAFAVSLRLSYMRTLSRMSISKFSLLTLKGTPFPLPTTTHFIYPSAPK